MKKNLWILIMIFISCDFPQDPEDSWNNAVADSLLVGVTSHPPFTIIQDDTIYGNEIELLQRFSQRNNLKLHFVKGSESELVKKLENHSLHIVIGGFEKKTVWEKKVGISAPYDGKHVLFIPKGENKLLEKLETFLFEDSSRHEKF